MWRHLLLLIFAALIASAQPHMHHQTTPILPIGSLGVKDVPITSNPLAEYPDLCQDRAGDIWVAYTQLDDNGQEMILLKHFRDMSQVDSLEVSGGRGYNDRPRLLCDAQGRLWIVWASKRDGNWDIYARRLESGSLSKEMRLTSSPAVEIHPALASDISGDIWIAFESLEQGNFDIALVKISDGNISPPLSVSSDPSNDFRPTLASVKGKTLTVAWDRQVGDSYRICLRTYDGRRWSSESIVSPEVGFNMAPTLAGEKDGSLLIAWHSNLNYDGSLGLTPWVHLVRQRKGMQREYWTLASERDQLKTGEDQGLEFPTMVVDGRGRAWVFARPSQGFYAQVVDGGAKSPLYRFEVEGWGGRGLNVRAIGGRDGSIYAVRRDLRAIYLSQIDATHADLVFDEPLRRAAVPSPHRSTSELRGEVPLQLPDGHRILFGDLHQHSSLSDGMGTPDECYTRSRFVRGYDFAALTDHEWFTANLLIPSEWEWIKLVGRQYESGDRFVAFAAYEWTTPRLPAGFGHKNVYFNGWDNNIFSFKTDARSSPGLFELLKKADAIAVPHHIGWTGADWDNHDGGVQPDVEIVSTHGAFEYMGNEPIMHRGGMPGNFVQDGLARGLRFGILGSTDGHGLRWHHGIGRKESEWETGLAGVVAKSNTKAEIMSALRHRRVYATSGARIYLDFRINDQWMGDSLTTAGHPTLVVNVEGTVPLYSVTILRNNEPLLVVGRDFSEGRGIRVRFQDATATPGRYWYYVRVLQEDGEMAWSSPIWVERREGK